MKLTGVVKHCSSVRKFIIIIYIFSIKTTLRVNDITVKVGNIVAVTHAFDNNF